MTKKHAALNELYQICQARNDFVFHNNLVKEISAKHKVGNPFDVTKLDNKYELPPEFLQNDICVLHLGGGFHTFINGINQIYHDFEPINERKIWTYRKSLLNEYNTSESNMLSVANNQRILHDFLFGEDLEFANLQISNLPKTYFPHRTKTNLNYFVGANEIKADKLQIEIDLTIEYNGIIGIFEAKNGDAKSFNIYQIYHPFLYYFNSNLPFEKIICVYLVRFRNSLKFWAYTFSEPLQMASLKLVKSCEYILEKA